MQDVSLGYQLLYSGEPLISFIFVTNGNIQHRDDKLKHQAFAVQQFGAKGSHITEGSIKLRLYCTYSDGARGLNHLLNHGLKIGDSTIKKGWLRVPEPGHDVYSGTIYKMRLRELPKTIEKLRILEKKEMTSFEKYIKENPFCAYALDQNPSEDSAETGKLTEKSDTESFPISERIEEIVASLQALATSETKIKFLRGLAEQLPKADLVVDSEDGSTVGITWKTRIVIILNEWDNISMSVLNVEHRVDDFQSFEDMEVGLIRVVERLRKLFDEV